MAFRRALFIRFGGLGDLLLATPTVRAVARAFPGIEADFVVGGDGMEGALAGHPLLRRVLCFDKNGDDARTEHFLPFLRDLRRQRYDLVINLQPNLRSYLMAAAAIGPWGRSLTFRKKMGVRRDTGRVAHAVDDFTKELRALGIGPVTDRGLDFVVPPAARAGMAEALARAGVSPSDALLVINPAASRGHNRWPADRFASVAAHFAARPGVTLVVSGAPCDTELAAQVASVDPRIVDLAGRLSVKEFGALLARADTLLTCDTGPMHIGAALRTPLVVLSGAADPDRTGPLTEDSTVLIDRTLPCVPCRDRECRRGDTLCMQNLSVTSVIEATEWRLAQARRSRSGYVLPIIA